MSKKHIIQIQIRHTFFSKRLLNSALIGSTIMLTSILTSGCAEYDVSDLNQFTIDTKLKYTGVVEALPAIAPYESYRYTMTEKRDPFKPSVSLVKTIALKLKRTSNGILPDEVRNKEDLERFALNTLVMVGILNNNGQNWAIIKAPDSSIYRVKKGNYIGENNGMILKITESKIDLKEIVSDGIGGWIERPNKLSISE